MINEQKSLELFQDHLMKHIKVAESLVHIQEEVRSVGQLFISSLSSGCKIMFAGNGGSASDAQHISAELVGRFHRERVGLPALSLTTDTSALTAIGNDYGFDKIFSRQIEALACSGDILVVISTSGRSQNLVLAVDKARSKGCHVVGFLGRDGGVLKDICDHVLLVCSEDTARIQEMHIFIGHFLCEMVDLAFV